MGKRTSNSGKEKELLRKTDPPHHYDISADESTMNVTGKPDSSLIHRRLLGCIEGLGKG